MSGALAGVLWMDQVVADGDDLAARPPLDGDTEVDVAVVGAGFTGLWTAFHLLRGDPGLIEGRGVDEVPHSLGLRQINSPAKISAQGEFARFGETGSSDNRSFNAETEDHGGAVAGYFDDVFRGI